MKYTMARSPGPLDIDVNPIVIEDCTLGGDALERTLLDLIPDMIFGSDDPDHQNNPPDEFIHKFVTGQIGRYDERVVTLAKLDQEPVGMLIATAVADDQIFLLNIGILPDHRGAGIGTALIKDLLNRHQDKYCLLGVHSKNTRAMALYDRLGFKRVEQSFEAPMFVGMGSDLYKEIDAIADQIKTYKDQLTRQGLTDLPSILMTNHDETRADQNISLASKEFIIRSFGDPVRHSKEESGGVEGFMDQLKSAYEDLLQRKNE